MELFKRLKELNLPSGKYAVFGSGPMCAQGLRECHDLDILVTKELFDEYKERPEWKLKKLESGEDGLENGNTEMFCTLALDGWGVKKTISEAETINGFHFAKLEEILRWKKLVNREKDLKDVELIEEYLNQKYEN